MTDISPPDHQIGCFQSGWPSLHSPAYYSHHVSIFGLNFKGPDGFSEMLRKRCIRAVPGGSPSTFNFFTTAAEMKAPADFQYMRYWYKGLMNWGLTFLSSPTLACVLSWNPLPGHGLLFICNLGWRPLHNEEHKVQAGSFACDGCAKLGLSS